MRYTKDMTKEEIIRKILRNASTYTSARCERKYYSGIKLEETLNILHNTKRNLKELQTMISPKEFHKYYIQGKIDGIRIFESNRDDILIDCQCSGSMYN